MVTDVRSRVGISNQEIASFCKNHHIVRLALFGSVLRDDFGPTSDIDVLVEFEPGRTPGFAFFGMQEELARLLGRKVDLNTMGFLHPRFRDRVRAESLVCYESR
jgi:predicted nucleotidyltransferase